MRFGCMLPTLGTLGGPDALIRTAQRAEALDYHSAWMAAAQIGKESLDEATRAPLSGSAAQVRADIARLRDLGVTQVIGRSAGGTLDAMLANLERFRETVGR